MRRPTDRAGLSLVEVLVALSVVGVLVGLLLPAVQTARGSALRAGCQSNLRQIGIGLHNHHGTHGTFPLRPGVEQFAANAEGRLTWLAHLLPFVGEGPLWSQTAAACASTPGARANPPHVGYATPVRLFVCPADARLLRTGVTPSGRTAAFTDYLGVGGSFLGPAVVVTPDGGRRAAPGVFSGVPGVRLADITDGTSSTLAAAERPPPATFNAGVWYTGFVVDPESGPNGTLIYGAPWGYGANCAGGLTFGPGRLDNPCDRNHFWSLHRGGGNFLFADGSARYLPYAAEPLMPALSTTAGSEPAELP